MDNADGKRVVIRRRDRINYVVGGLCDYYNIGWDELFKKSLRNPAKVMRKKMTVKILREVADISYKEISQVMGYIPDNTGYVFEMLQDVNSQMSIDRKLTIEYNRILKHLNL